MDVAVISLRCIIVPLSALYGNRYANPAVASVAEEMLVSAVRAVSTVAPQLLLSCLDRMPKADCERYASFALLGAEA